MSNIVISGMGVISSIGQGKNAFIKSLLEGQHAFGLLQRPGRHKDVSFIGAEIPTIHASDRISKRLFRTASLSAQAALVTLEEAWHDAKLDEVDPYRIGLIIGGSNVQQREIVLLTESYSKRVHYIRPSYALSFMDSDLCGVCTEQFGIKGVSYTVGGASASGQMAIIEAIKSVLSGQVDVCIAMGALMDLSYIECQALRSLGAMGSDRYIERPDLACRPFDQMRDGFIFGESCGVVVIERMDHMSRRQLKPYGKIGGWAMKVDGNRNPNPSYEGEVLVIREALKLAKLSPNEIDYINPHGTGSPIGDEVELKAIKDSQLSNAYINATKSITGHGLSSAGTIEVIATLLQMKESRLHPTRNLLKPMCPSLNWVTQGSIQHNITNAITLSMGFGGFNTALCIQKI